MYNNERLVNSVLILRGGGGCLEEHEYLAVIKTVMKLTNEI